MRRQIRFIALALTLAVLSITVISCGKSDGFGVGGKVIITGGSR